MLNPPMIPRRHAHRRNCRYQRLEVLFIGRFNLLTEPTQQQRRTIFQYKSDCPAPFLSRILGQHGAGGNGPSMLVMEGHPGAAPMPEREPAAPPAGYWGCRGGQLGRLAPDLPKSLSPAIPPAATDHTEEADAQKYGE